jgi:hypothetical protein
VSEARKRKNRRLKQAKEEVGAGCQAPPFLHLPPLQAQTEIERYKAEREKAFKDNETKNVGSKDDIAAKIEADTKVRIPLTYNPVYTDYKPTHSPGEDRGNEPVRGEQQGRRYPVADGACL